MLSAMRFSVKNPNNFFGSVFRIRPCSTWKWGRTCTRARARRLFEDPVFVCFAESAAA